MKKSGLLWMIGVASFVIMLILLGIPKPWPEQKQVAEVESELTIPAPGRPVPTRAGVGAPTRAARNIAPDAVEIVTSKLSQFARSRHGIAVAIARKHKIEISPQASEFFAAVEGGNWERAKALYETLQTRRHSGELPEHSEALWPAILETYGAAEAAHNWRAQTLLDYGDGILRNLRPGMVYVGGTDPGRFIPAMMAETSEDEHAVVLTQNALADRTYLDYANFLYGERLAGLSKEDSDKAFSDYIADAQKRYEHDQQFPNERKQLRPGEDIRITEGRVEVSGQVAVMAINERLFQKLMEINPGVPFALEESFPFTSTYPNAVPLGPIMELGVSDPESSYTTEAAARTLEFWQSTASQFATDQQQAKDLEARKAYSKMAAGQAHLYGAHGMQAQAEQVYQVAADICPSNPEVVFGFVNLLLQQARPNDAFRVAERGAAADPENVQIRNLLEQLSRYK